MLLKIKSELAADIRQQFCNCVTGFLVAGREDLQHKNRNQEIDEKVEATALKCPESSLELPLTQENLSLKNLKHLKVLKMESCVNITDTGIANGIHLSKLQELDIKLCTNVTGDFVNLDNHSGFNEKIFNNLKTLNLSQCTALAEKNLYKIILYQF